MELYYEFAFGTLLWVVLAIVGLYWLGDLTVNHFIVVTFIGTVLVAEVTSPLQYDSPWRRKVRYALTFYAIIFGIVIVNRGI